MEEFESRIQRDLSIKVERDIETFEQRFSDKFGKKFNQLSGHVERIRKSVR
jgi:hypothetical protein